VNQLQQWGPVAIIVGGYLLGFFFQNRRLDDLRDLVNKRIDDVKDVLRAEIRASEARLSVKFAEIEQRLERLEGERRVIQ